MPQYDIKHDEAHRFLRWGIQDAVFIAWRNYFESKGVEYEIGGGRDSWTIYKHMLFTDIDEKKITRCCPMEDDL